LVEVLEGGDGVPGELVQVITTHVQAQQIPAQHIFYSALEFSRKKLFTDDNLYNYLAEKKCLLCGGQKGQRQSTIKILKPV
jgi:hypothetical protein